MTRTITRVFATLLTTAAAIGFVACTEASTGPAASASTTTAPQSDATVSFQVVERSATGLTVDLFYLRPEGQAGPRQMELWLSPSASLSYVSAEPLEAATRADKRVVAQAKENGELRVVVLGTTSLAQLESGALARLTFDVTAAAGELRLELLERMPMFAPAEANQNIRLPDPLVLGGS